MRIRYNIQLKNTPYIPFTYLVKFTDPTSKQVSFYYGVRSASGCNPQELFTTYFTSSQEVHALINKHGLSPFEYEIRQCFPGQPTKACTWELKVLWRIKAHRRDDFLNRCAGGCIFSLKGERNHAYGKPFSEDHRKKISEANKRWAQENPELIAAQALLRTGKPGTSPSKEARIKMSQSRKGRKLSAETCEKMRQSMLIWVKTHPEEIRKLGDRMRGRTLSDETKKRISESKKGTIVSEETKEKHRQYCGEKSSMWGKKASEETRKKMSEDRKGKQVGADNPNFGKNHSDEVRKKMSEVKHQRMAERKGAEYLLYPMNRKCLNCPVEFQVSWRRRDKVYCSTACGARAMWDIRDRTVPIDKVCAFCNTPFQATVMHRFVTFCSKSCASKQLWANRNELRDPYIFLSPLKEALSVSNLSEFCKEHNLGRQHMGAVHRGERVQHKGWTKWLH